MLFAPNWPVAMELVGSNAGCIDYLALQAVVFSANKIRFDFIRVLENKPAVLQCRFQEEVALKERMQAIGHIIAHEGFPHFICFQVLHCLLPIQPFSVHPAVRMLPLDFH